jgi:superfamily I DNA/RNA helicase
MNQTLAGVGEAALQFDQRARHEALDVRRSMLLQAPAGSGKTTVLTARFLALLAAVDTPEEILAITFTRKAAAEMHHRILATLQAASAGQAIPGIEPGLLQAARARDLARGWNLLQNPSRLRIQTIDALNHWLATHYTSVPRAAAWRWRAGSRRWSRRWLRPRSCCSIGSTTTGAGSRGCW